jgi:2-(1,2-epoxy-1,2-dihydrophenyl)acetyl-CoA isomerase
MESLILASVSGGVGRLTFNRPAQRNAMSVEMMKQLRTQLESLDADPTVRCVVIDGAGDNFVAGGDIKAWDRLRSMTPEERGDDFRRRLGDVQPLISLLDNYRVPLVAAVRGYAAGAGLCFVAAADFVIADESATFLFANVRTSLVPDMGLSHFLPRAIGYRQAVRLSLLSGSVSATEAHRIGLVTDLVAAGDFERSIKALTDTLIALPATAVRETRRIMRHAGSGELERRYQAECDGLAASAATEDFIEAITAFSQRRQPVFRR